eukprot:contig_7899_g1860
MSLEQLHEDGDSEDDVQSGVRAPRGIVAQDPFRALLKVDETIASKTVQLSDLRTKRDANTDVLLSATLLDWQLEIRLRLDKSLNVDLDRLREELAELRKTRKSLIESLLATRPIWTLLQTSGRYLEQSHERSPTSTLQTKPPYDPAGLRRPVDLDPLIVATWFYLVLGKAMPSPGTVDVDVIAALQEVTQGSAKDDPEAAPAQDVRHVGLIEGSAGMGKTHLGIDAWYYRDELDQPRFAAVAAHAGVSSQVWTHVCSTAKTMRVCCINFNGASSWGDADCQFVSLSPWFKHTYPDGHAKPPPADEAKKPAAAQTVPQTAAQVEPLPATLGESLSSSVAASQLVNRVDSPRAVLAGPLPGDHETDEGRYADAHTLPLYLRVLWGLLHQAEMSYKSFATMALTGLRLRQITVASIKAEAEAALSARRHAIIVDELTLARMCPGDRQLSELYRHIIWNAKLQLDGGDVPAVDFSKTFDDAVSSSLLYGSPNQLGEYENPSLPPAMINGLATLWVNDIADLKDSGHEVTPEVCNVLRSCSRLLSASGVPDPGRGWEVTSFWAEVMMSHVRHGAARFLHRAPGVSGVADYSRVSMKDLYKSAAKLEERPVHHALLSDVLVDATRPLTIEDVEQELITRIANMDDVLCLPTEKLLSQVFMMRHAHPSFDLVRFFPVVHDPRPDAVSSKRTNGVLAVCFSSKSTTNKEVSVPLSLAVEAEALLPKAFGDKNWDAWQHNVVHVTICNHTRSNPRSASLTDPDAAERTVVLCRDDFDAIYGSGLSGFLSSAPVLHGTKVVR